MMLQYNCHPPSSIVNCIILSCILMAAAAPPLDPELPRSFVLQVHISYLPLEL